MFLKEAQRSCNYWNRKCAYISPARDNGECVECNRSNREHSTTGWELYWIQHSGRSSFKSTNLIITARKGFWHSMVWHLALLNCPRSLGCQPCRFLFAEGSGKTPADRNRADSFLFIKKKRWQWILQHICSLQCELQSTLAKTRGDVAHIGDVWITNRCFSCVLNPVAD